MSYDCTDAVSDIAYMLDKSGIRLRDPNNDDNPWPIRQGVAILIAQHNAQLVAVRAARAYLDDDGIMSLRNIASIEIDRVLTMAGERR